MKVLQNAKVRYKILCMGITSILMTILVGTMGIFYLKNVNDNSEMMFGNFEKAIYVGKILDIKGDDDSYLLELMISTDLKHNEELKAKIESADKDIQRFLQEYESYGVSNEEKKVVDEYSKTLEEAKPIRAKIIDAILQNKHEEAYRVYSSEYQQISEKMEEQTDSFNDILKQHGESADKKNDGAFESALITNTIITIATILIIGAFIIIINRLISKPIESFHNYILKFSKGDLSEATLEASKDAKIYEDEIGALGNAIIVMRQQLWKVMSKINEISTLVASSSQELSASTEESLSMIEEITSSIDSIAQGADTQLQNIELSVKLLEDISYRIEQSNQKIDNTVAMTETAMKSAKDGEIAIIQTKTQMTMIENSVLNANGIITELGERSTEIGQIVDTISSIAEQTNLLSLNAAIEAARAGEQGKGFAVVADEVRDLAENSALSAAKISKLVQSIQIETKKAVSSIQEGTSQVRVGMQVVEAAEGAFHNITGLVGNMTEHIDEIAGSSKDIREKSQKILLSAKDIQALSRKFSDISENISASMEEQTATVNEITKSSEGLSEIGETLVTEVSAFQL